MSVVKIKNLIQVESLVNVSEQLLNEEYVDWKVYLIKDELDKESLEDPQPLLYKEGIYEITEKVDEEGNPLDPREFYFELVPFGTDRRDYENFVVSPGWSFVNKRVEYVYDEKEAMMNFRMKFTPWDDTMEEPEYEYTNKPLTKILPSAKKKDVVFGITSEESFPTPIAIELYKDEMVLQEDVDNFSINLCYKYDEDLSQYVGFISPSLMSIKNNQPDLFDALVNKLDEIGV